MTRVHVAYPTCKNWSLHKNEVTDEVNKTSEQFKYNNNMLLLLLLFDEDSRSGTKDLQEILDLNIIIRISLVFFFFSLFYLWRMCKSKK